MTSLHESARSVAARNDPDRALGHPQPRARHPRRLAVEPDGADDLGGAGFQPVKKVLDIAGGSRIGSRLGREDFGEVSDVEFHPCPAGAEGVHDLVAGDGEEPWA